MNDLHFALDYFDVKRMSAQDAASWNAASNLLPTKILVP